MSVTTRNNVIKHEMIGGFCLRQRWQSHTYTDMAIEQAEYLRTYPPMGYSTRFTEPVFDEDSGMIESIMSRDKTCD